MCNNPIWGIYTFIILNDPGPVAVIPPTSMPQPVIEPTNPPLPIQSPNNPVPQPTFTSAPTNISAPTTSSKFGTFNNPVPIGIGYTFPGFGTLTVIKSSWLSGQTGFAIVDLSFSCERPVDKNVILVI